MKSHQRDTISDGKLVLTLERADEGGYTVTSLLDPELITEAETVEDAFDKGVQGEAIHYFGPAAMALSRQG